MNRSLKGICFTVAGGCCWGMSGVMGKYLFDAKDLKGYASYDAKACPMCKAKQKIDAIVNGYGYSKM